MQFRLERTKSTVKVTIVSMVVGGKCLLVYAITVCFCVSASLFLETSQVVSFFVSLSLSGYQEHQPINSSFTFLICFFVLDYLCRIFICSKLVMH